MIYVRELVKKRKTVSFEIFHKSRILVDSKTQCVGAVLSFVDGQESPNFQQKYDNNEYIITQSFL
jgi:hypothetical protein